MWSDEESEGWETERMPDISVSTGFSQSSFDSSNRSPRAELSMLSGERSEADSEVRSPAPKRFKWTEEEEKNLSKSPVDRQWSPVLAKTDDGRQVVTVSTSSEASQEIVDIVPSGMRRVRYPDTGRPSIIPDDDVVEQCFREVFSQDEEEETGEDEGER